MYRICVCEKQRKWEEKQVCVCVKWKRCVQIIRHAAFFIVYTNICNLVMEDVSLFMKHAKLDRPGGKEETRFLYNLLLLARIPVHLPHCPCSTPKHYQTSLFAASASILFSLPKHNQFNRTKLKGINCTQAPDWIKYRYCKGMSSTYIVCVCGFVCVGFSTVLCLLAQPCF